MRRIPHFHYTGTKTVVELLNMAPLGDITLPAARRVRRSVGGADSRKTRDKENATIDVGAEQAARAKKARSKSMGPGGLDALKVGSGNRRAV